MQQNGSAFWSVARLLAAALTVINLPAAAAVMCADLGTLSDIGALVKKF